jgi:hypothetical protein
MNKVHETHSYLAIGGPIDGMTWATETHTTRFAITAPASADMWYSLRFIEGEAKTFGIWLYEKVAVDEALERLFARYPRRDD